MHAGKTKLRKHQRASVAKQFGEVVGRSEGGKDCEVMEGIEEEDAVPGVPGSEGYSAANRLLGLVSLCGRVSGSGFHVWRVEMLGMIAVCVLYSPALSLSQPHRPIAVCLRSLDVDALCTVCSGVGLQTALQNLVPLPKNTCERSSLSPAGRISIS